MLRSNLSADPGDRIRKWLGRGALPLSPLRATSGSVQSVKSIKRISPSLVFPPRDIQFRFELAWCFLFPPRAGWLRPPSIRVGSFPEPPNAIRFRVSTMFGEATPSTSGMNRISPAPAPGASTNSRLNR
jgi:hypothetical protein